MPSTRRAANAVAEHYTYHFCYSCPMRRCYIPQIANERQRGLLDWFTKKFSPDDTMVDTHDQPVGWSFAIDLVIQLKRMVG